MPGVAKAVGLLIGFIVAQSPEPARGPGGVVRRELARAPCQCFGRRPIHYEAPTPSTSIRRLAVSRGQPASSHTSRGRRWAEHRTAFSLLVCA